MRSRAHWDGADVLDVGCGSGFHLPLFAATARSVTGIEPHAPLVALARRRTKALPQVRVLEGLAEQLPVPSHSIDVVHARWAYFFGPGAEPGLGEIGRVLRRGGAALVIDNDPTTSTFGRWFGAGFPTVDPTAVEAFWSRHGWVRDRIAMGWRFESAADLEAVVRIELPPAAAEAALAEHAGAGGGLEIDYSVNLWSKRF